MSLKLEPIENLLLTYLQIFPVEMQSPSYSLIGSGDQIVILNYKGIENNTVIGKLFYSLVLLLQVIIPL
jgi:hypothetical protein